MSEAGQVKYPVEGLLVPLRFGFEEAVEAMDGWGMNCGPGALCAVTGKTPAEVRGSLFEFESKGYTNPTLMSRIIKGLGYEYDKVFECQGARRPEDHDIRYPQWGLVRIQFAGPWTRAGVPVRARYRHSHWVGVCGVDLRGLGVRRRMYPKFVFDINAIFYGGWMPFDSWRRELVPWLVKECQPKTATGEWWPTHGWGVEVK